MLYLNNKITSEAEASISINDRGLLLADGVFETIRCQDGAAVALDLHWERLQRGLRLLNIPFSYSIAKVDSIIKELLQRNNQFNAGVRLTITRGTGKRGVTPPQHVQPTVLITTFDVKVPSKLSLKLCISDYTRNERSPLSQCKTLGYTDHIAARVDAAQRGFDDAILLNSKGEVCCTTSANIFTVKDDVLFTPDTKSGALNGVMRQRILRWAKERGIEAQTTSISQAMLVEADEVFISNAIIGSMPVSAVNQTTITGTKLKKVLTRCLL